MTKSSIIYWKWDDSHVETGKYLKQIDDIVKRSCFEYIYITTHWCHQGIVTDEMHEHIKKACDYIHQKGRKIIFEIDARAEKSYFSKKYPDKRMGFLYTKELNANESTECSFKIGSSYGNGELFLGDWISGDELIGVFSFQKDEKGRIIDGSLKDITEKSSICRTDEETVRVQVKDVEKNRYVFVIVNVWVDFPDFFSKERREFLGYLFNKYSDIPLDGVALDELGLPWHPDFGFDKNSFDIWDRSPMFSYDMQERYRQLYGSDYITDCIYRYCDSSDSKTRIAAINRYFEIIREQIVDEERYFYLKAKEIYGEDVFVGVHPTWYAIEEVQNTPEIWKNGVTWWAVPRDYGFTDEIMLYPVRFALTHKANSSLFFNMWYSEATLVFDTYIKELWRNLRYGGRTISLGYECREEPHCALQLNYGDYLEKISQIEKIAQKLDEYQKAPAASDILIIMGIEAATNFLANVDGRGKWDTFQGKFKESFTIARDIFNMGYNCDLVGSYEIYDNSISFKDGYLHYGNQQYKYAIIAYPEFSKPAMFDFIKNLKKSKCGFSIIGDCNYDFDGNNVAAAYKELTEGCDLYLSRPEAADLVNEFSKYSVRTNRVPCGCVLQDNSVILTAPAPANPTGNVFETEFTFLNRRYYVKAEDIVFLRFDSSGNITDSFSPKFIDFKELS